jgi:hypothetical protein
VEQIIAKLREAEKLQAEGLTIPQTCKWLQISDQIFHRWRLKYGALKEDEAQRLKALAQENSRLLSWLRAFATSTAPALVRCCGWQRHCRPPAEVRIRIDQILQ